MSDLPPGWDVEVMEGEVLIAVDEDGTEHPLRVEIDAKNLPSVRLLGIELMALHDEMRVGASPFADRLGRIIERFAAEEST